MSLVKVTGLYYKKKPSKKQPVKLDGGHQTDDAQGGDSASFDPGSACEHFVKTKSRHK